MRSTRSVKVTFVRFAESHLCSSSRRATTGARGFVRRCRLRRSRLPASPHIIVNPDGKPWLPVGIEQVAAPTAVFEIDTFSATERRIRSAAMYDYAFVFHPRYDHAFRARGIAGARLLPHAAERDLFEGPELERHYDVGWVGRAGSLYQTRDAVLRSLASRFRMNDTAYYYTSEEMALVYRSSRSVVNLSRDDYPQDANMRCFEVMASGALLITHLPTELTDLGFAENVHFAGYRDPRQVPDIVASWLARDQERIEIASRARALVLREHTYDARVQTILYEMGSGVRANARSWPRWHIAASRLQYHVAFGDTPRALEAFRDLSREAPLRGLQNSWRLGRLGAMRAKRLLRRS